MTGMSYLSAGPAVAPPPFLERLLHASQRGRGLTRVMVATDFSMCADLALARALRLALGPGASLTLFHASSPGEGPGAPQALEERCLHRMAEAARRRLRSREPVEVREELRAGEAAEQAAGVARALEVELVVAGRPHAARGRPEAGRGATVRRLVRGLDRPLLVVGEHPARAYQRPLVAVDLTEDSRRALELVLRVCPAPMGVEVLHVPAGCLAPEGGAAREQGLAARQELEAAARKALSRFIAPYREAGRECTPSVRCGEPLEEALLAEAAERGADLLALGRHGAQAPGVRLSERVAMRAGCDVLVAKASCGPPAGGEPG